MTDLDLHEWIPSRVAWDGNIPSMDWVYFAEDRYRDPFFADTLERCMQRPFNVLFRHRTSMEMLEEWAVRSPGIPPTGFIFHVSRCGSTLVPNLLATLPSALNLSEVSPIDALLRARMRNPEIPEATHASWLRALVSALGQKRTNLQNRLFVKFDAWNSINLPLIKAAFPEVPWIFVYRDPVEVMVSALRSRGAHTVPLALPPSLFGMEVMEVVQMPVEQFVARVLASIYRAGLRSSTPGRSILVNYSQLPEATWTTVANAFGLDLTEGEVQGMRVETGTHSKNRSIFVPDSEQKRREVTDAARDAARQWIYPIYEELEAKRRE